ncbi:MAG: hypothetical protein JWN09_2982 [Microbacteriaceae bacterium]|jgi:hypothetical protein|nr:hypothetical protein [Microbacteriaceae bacterium]
MKFMIMVFGEQADLHQGRSEWVERMVAFMVRLDDELAQSGELIYSEVLENGESATVVDQHGGVRGGSFALSGASLSRYWVVKVPAEARAIEIASSVAAVMDATVEVRRCLEQSIRP